VIEVWFPRSLDREHGGFLCDFDRRWKPCGPHEKLLEFQARQTWFAAEASQIYPEDANLREAVQHGFAYLRGALWDRTCGGWFHRLDRSGMPISDSTKHTHGHAYAISACAAVYKATGDRSALDLAREGFEWIDRHAHDGEHGGYFGYLRRDGSVVSADDELKIPIDTTGIPVGCKDINVHSDLLETFIVLGRASSDPRIAERLAETAEIVSHRLASPLGAHFHVCLRDWTPVPHLTRFGYQFQSAFRLYGAASFLDGSGDMLVVARRLVDHALHHGWDRKRGGFYYAGTGLGPSAIEDHDLTVRRKIWWVQAEALKALLTMRRIAPKKERYAKILNAQWHYLQEHFIDHAFGGFRRASPETLPRWRQMCPYFAPRSHTLKGSVWKDCSHEGRALLYCLSIFAERDTELERSSAAASR
jgi:mannobiose 2-epimerase